MDVPSWHPLLTTTFPTWLGKARRDGVEPRADSFVPFEGLASEAEAAPSSANMAGGGVEVPVVYEAAVPGQDPPDGEVASGPTSLWVVIVPD